MRWLIDRIDHIVLGGYTAQEWLAIAALILLAAVGLLFILQRVTGMSIAWNVVRRGGDARRRPEDRLPGGREKILIVDDEEGVRESTARILRELGYTIVTVENGLAAVGYMQSNGADLILLDLRMEPGLDGIETFRRIREMRPLQKAIVMTAYAGPAEIAAVRSLGIQHYIIKPAPLTLLARAIREELDGP